MPYVGVALNKKHAEEVYTHLEVRVMQAFSQRESPLFDPTWEGKGGKEGKEGKDGKDGKDGDGRGGAGGRRGSLAGGGHHGAM